MCLCICIIICIRVSICTCTLCLYVHYVYRYMYLLPFRARISLFCSLGTVSAEDAVLGEIGPVIAAARISSTMSSHDFPGPGQGQPKVTVLELFFNASFLIGSVSFDKGCLALFQSKHSLSTRKENHDLYWLVAQRSLFQDSFEDALPSGSAWKYVGPKSYNNLTSLEVADNDGTVYHIPPIYVLEMGAKTPASLIQVLRAFMDHAVFNEGGHCLQTDCNVLCRVVKGYNSDPWTARIKITVAPRGVVSASAMHDILAFMKKYPFCEWDGSLCYCESPDVNFPTAATSDVHVKELLRRRDLELVPSLSTRDSPCRRSVADPALSFQDFPSDTSQRSAKMPKLQAPASVAKLPGTLPVAPCSCGTSPEHSSDQKPQVPREASDGALPDFADKHLLRRESKPGCSSVHVAGERLVINDRSLLVSALVQNFVVPRLHTLVTDMEKTLAVRVAPRAGQDPEQFYNALSKGHALKNLVSSLLTATWLQDIHKLSSDSIVGHLRQVCHLAKKKHGLPQRCLDPVVVVLNQVSADTDKLSLFDPNTLTDFESFLVSGTKSTQAFASRAPATKCKAVLNVERDHFRRQLYIQQLDSLGALTPGSRSPSPLGRQKTCPHKFDNLRWFGNPFNKFANCSACRLPKVIFHDLSGGHAFLCEAEPSSVQVPAPAELSAHPEVT